MPLVDGISRRQLEDRVRDVLKAADTLAGDSVFEPRDWPTDPKLFPIVLVQAPRERKEILYPGQPAFNTTITMVVVGRVWGATVEEANSRVNILAIQIEDALLISPLIAEAVQQFISIETQIAVSSQGGEQIGEVGLSFEFSVYQAYGPDGPLLTDVMATLQPAPDPGPGQPTPVVIDIKENLP